MRTEEAEAERMATEFFRLRFPRRSLENEKATGYFSEWARRFELGIDEVYADNESLRVIKAIKIRRSEKW